MLYYMYLFHDLKDLSPNEGLVYSELLFNSLISNPHYKVEELLCIDIVKEELQEQRLMGWKEEIDYYPMEISKIIAHTELTYPTVKKILSDLAEKGYTGKYYIKCPISLLDEGYIKIPYKTNLKGRELIFYALLLSRAYLHNHTVDTWARKLADLCGIQESHVYKIINHLKKNNLVIRQEDGRLHIFKPSQSE